MDLTSPNGSSKEAAAQNWLTDCCYFITFPATLRLVLSCTLNPIGVSDRYRSIVAPSLIKGTDRETTSYRIRHSKTVAKPEF